MKPQKARPTIIMNKLIDQLNLNFPHVKYYLSSDNTLYVDLHLEVKSSKIILGGFKFNVNCNQLEPIYSLDSVIGDYKLSQLKLTDLHSSLNEDEKLFVINTLNTYLKSNLAQ